MSKVLIQSEVDISNVMQSFSKLTVSELELLVNQFNALIATKKATNKSQRIEEVTNLIHQSVISDDKLKRHAALVDKLERLTMSDEEKHELQLLADEDEKMQNQRLKYMIELSHLRQVPFAKIRDEFRFKSSVDV